MSVNNEGIIVILSSPSGAGKTTLVKEISKKKNFKISIYLGFIKKQSRNKKQKYVL